MLLFSHGSFILRNSSATLMHSHELIQIMSCTVTTIALLFKGTVHAKMSYIGLLELIGSLEKRASTFLLRNFTYPWNSL